MPEIYTNREDLLKVHKQVTEQVVAEQVVPQFVEMIRASDMRIGSIAQMISNLTKGAEEFAKAANNMTLSSAQNIAMSDYLIKANIELSKANQNITNIFEKEIQELRRELQSLYHEYRHLVERLLSENKCGTASSNVKITL